MCGNSKLSTRRQNKNTFVAKKITGVDKSKKTWLMCPNSKLSAHSQNENAFIVKKITHTFRKYKSNPSFFFVGLFFVSGSGFLFSSFSIRNHSSQSLHLWPLFRQLLLWHFEGGDESGTYASSTHCPLICCEIACSSTFNTIYILSSSE